MAQNQKQEINIKIRTKILQLSSLPLYHAAVSKLLVSLEVQHAYNCGHSIKTKYHAYNWNRKKNIMQ
jgi:hypothetical protein